MPDLSPRPDPYTWPHKAQRRLLFAATGRAGQLDPTDAGAAAEAVDAARRVVHLLREHAAHEERFLHPLLRRRLPALVAALEEEHGALEARLEEVGAAAALLDAGSGPAERRVSADALYKALNGLVAVYLAHLAREEAQLPAYREAFSDDELGSVLARFHASRGPEEALSDMRLMLPALSREERRALLGGVRKSSPAEALPAVAAAARAALSPTEWAEVRAVLEGHA